MSKEIVFPSVRTDCGFEILYGHCCHNEEEMKAWIGMSPTFEIRDISDEERGLYNIVRPFPPEDTEDVLDIDPAKVNPKALGAIIDLLNKYKPQ